MTSFDWERPGGRSGGRPWSGPHRDDSAPSAQAAGGAPNSRKSAQRTKRRRIDVVAIDEDAERSPERERNA